MRTNVTNIISKTENDILIFSLNVVTLQPNFTLPLPSSPLYCAMEITKYFQTKEKDKPDGNVVNT